MAKERFKAALNTTAFPMVSTRQTRTVLDTRSDINVRTPRDFSDPADSSDYSIAQMLYCENVVPTGEGLQSIGYETVIEGLPGNNNFDQAVTLRDEDENNFIFSPSAGLNYIYTANAGTWASVNPILDAAGILVTRGYVNGRTFICYEGKGIYEYDAVAKTFLPQPVTLPPGVVTADVRGIGASSNYLLIFTDLTVHWSSLVDPLDFVPSLTTGAGFAIPQDVKARITALLGIAGGYIVYTSKNAVAAVYTNNSRSPFSFKEVSNAGGISTYEQVTSEQNAGPHYAWTTGGLQKITIQGAETISPEINDFIAGREWESFDPTTNQLTQHLASTEEFPVKLAFISSRWLFVSYNTGDGSGIYNYALVYDTVLKRWGKLKVDHVDCFYYPYPNLFGDLTYGDLDNTSYNELANTSYAQLSQGIYSTPPSKLCVGFLSQDGTVKLLRMDYNKSEQQEGVIIFGKFQSRRSKVIVLQTVDIEGAYQDTFDQNPAFSAYVLPSYDGYKPDGAIQLKLLKVGNKFAKYAKRVSGLNLQICFKGTFAFSSFLMEITEDGDR